MKSLAYCVSMVQLDRDDFSSRNYQRYLQYAINTYKEEIGMGISPSVNVMYGNLADNTLGVVDMPQDYEYYTKVAILVNGRYLTLTLNPDMPLNRRWDSCGDDINDADNNGTMNFPTIASAGYGYMFAGHFRAGNFVGELYGLGGGMNRAGYFTVDEKLRRFQFTNVPRTEVVIEYVSNGASEGSMVDDLAVPVIRYGVHHQLSLFDNVNQADKTRFAQMFYGARETYRINKTAPTIDDYLDTTYKSTRSSPKR